jgi:hypothetical protein
MFLLRKQVTNQRRLKKFPAISVVDLFFSQQPKRQVAIVCDVRVGKQNLKRNQNAHQTALEKCGARAVVKQQHTVSQQVVRLVPALFLVFLQSATYQKHLSAIAVAINGERMSR